jgi:hypothetical protein
MDNENPTMSTKKMFGLKSVMGRTKKSIVIGTMAIAELYRFATTRS